MGWHVLDPPGLYKRLFAWGFAHGAATYDRHLTDHRRRLLAPVEGDVLEIGPGTGLNLPHYPPQVRWTGVEPNPFMHPYLLREADRLGLDVRLLRGTAETLEFGDGTFDAVVSTHVLCSVRDPRRALAEIRRVLKEGGRFYFLEHLAASPGSWPHHLQRLIGPVWRVLADGCRSAPETELLLQHAGFSGLDDQRFTLPYPVLGPHSIGVATK